ncbi:MAG: methionyl-tRNA formyltransferase [Vicinamibacterales bacterium]
MVTPPILRIVYFGTPAFAVPTLQALIGSRHEVLAVVSQPDKPKGRGHHTAPTPTKAVAAAYGIPVWQPERLRDEAFLRQVSDSRADLGVVAAYGRILPEALLQIPRLGMINVHGSVLPRWRGAAPVHRAVIEGDPDTGVTIMRVVKELDAGAMFVIGRRPIGPDETSSDVERAIAELGAALAIQVVDLLAAGTAVETPQPAEGITYASKLSKAESAVAWTEPASRIHNLVRGLQPWPLVAARLADTRVLIHRTALTDEVSGGAPATVVRAEADRLEIVAGDGRVLRILELQPEGRRVMRARDFLAGRRIEPGAAIGPA